MLEGTAAVKVGGTDHPFGGRSVGRPVPPAEPFTLAVALVLLMFSTHREPERALSTIGSATGAHPNPGRPLKPAGARCRPLPHPLGAAAQSFGRRCRSRVRRADEEMPDARRMVQRGGSCPL